MTEKRESIFRVSGAHGAALSSLLLSSFFINLGFFGNSQAIGHVDDANPIKESFVVFIGFEHGPFGFIRVRQDGALEGDGSQCFRTRIIALLRGRKQWGAEL